MAIRTFEKHIIIHTQPQTVYEHLADPMNYMGLQPLLVDVGDVRQGTDADGHTIFDYDMVELLRFWGIIPYRNKNRVRMTLQQPGTALHATVYSALGVRVEFVFRCLPHADGTEVRDHVTLHSPRLLTAYIVGQAHAAQQTLLDNLKQRLETGG